MQGRGNYVKYFPDHGTLLLLQICGEEQTTVIRIGTVKASCSLTLLQWWHTPRGNPPALQHRAERLTTRGEILADLVTLQLAESNPYRRLQNVRLQLDWQSNFTRISSALQNVHTFGSCTVQSLAP